MLEEPVGGDEGGWSTIVSDTRCGFRSPGLRRGLLWGRIGAVDFTICYGTKVCGSWINGIPAAIPAACPIPDTGRRQLLSFGGMSMDILSEILKQVLEGAAQQQAPAPQQRAPQQQPQQQQQQRPPQQQPQQQGGQQGMPSANDLQDIFTQIFGGGSAQKLPEVVKQFEDKGMRDQVDSWVRTGPNKPVDRRQIEDVFGRRELDEIAVSRNIDREQLAEVLSRYIPKIIDELTPSGQMQARR